jgi:prophage DNA circulation protein
MAKIHAIPAAISAVEGIRKGMQRFDRAAVEVARSGQAAHNATVLELSAEARNRALEGDLVQPLVDEMVAEHTVAANVRTLHTVDEMYSALNDIVRPNRGR